MILGIPGNSYPPVAKAATLLEATFFEGPWFDVFWDEACDKTLRIGCATVSIVRSSVPTVVVDMVLDYVIRMALSITKCKDRTSVLLRPWNKGFRVAYQFASMERQSSVFQSRPIATFQKRQILIPHQDGLNNVMSSA